MNRFDNETLEAAARLLETTAGNSLYQSAWRAGAKRIRALKNATDGDAILNDASEQISNSSSRPVA